MDKKNYVKPTITRVKLVSKNAVLGVCHSSPNLYPKEGLVFCKVVGGNCPTT